MLRFIIINEDGVLSFEWIAITTLLIIGLVGGLATVRDAINIEAWEYAEAMLSSNTTYAVSEQDFTATDTNGTQRNVKLSGFSNPPVPPVTP